MAAPVFYTFGGSVWAAAPELAIPELGYESGAIDKKVVNLIQGDNFEPSFLKINPHATLPTLSAGGKTYTSTVDVINYLVKNAPNAPKADAVSTVNGKDVITRVHEDEIDPNFALFCARNDEELKAKASSPLAGFPVNRQNSLERHSITPGAAAFAEFYKEKLASNGQLAAIYQGTAPPEHKQGFYAKSIQHWTNIRNFVLNEFPQYLPGSGFIAGERPGTADFHVGAWLARIVATQGATDVTALEKELGQPVPEKVVKYFQLWSERSSWTEVYSAGLH